MKCAGVPSELFKRYGYTLRASSYVDPTARVDAEIEKTARTIEKAETRLANLKREREAILAQHVTVIPWPNQ